MDGGHKSAWAAGAVIVLLLGVYVVYESGYAPPWLALLVTRIIQFLSRL